MRLKEGQAEDFYLLCASALFPHTGFLARVDFAAEVPSCFSPSHIWGQFDFRVLKSPVQSQPKHALLTPAHASLSRLRLPTKFDRRMWAGRAWSVSHASPLLCCFCAFQDRSGECAEEGRAMPRPGVSGIQNQCPLYNRVPDADCLPWGWSDNHPSFLLFPDPGSVLPGRLLSLPPAATSMVCPTSLSLLGASCPSRSSSWLGPFKMCKYFI